ncbi:MAG: hypothetical protein AAF717_21245 [Bacteroidota bacterium]
MILVTLLPFIHEFFIGEDGTLLPWVPFEERKIFNYSMVGVFLFYFLIQVKALIGLWFWKFHLINKRHEKYLWVPIIAAIYHMVILFLSARSTIWNNALIKLIGISMILIVVGLWDYRSELAYRQKNKRAFELFGGSNKRVVGLNEILWWIGMLALSCMLFVHDFMTYGNGKAMDWLPDFGFVEAMTHKTIVDGETVTWVWEFGSYRILIYTFMIYLYLFFCWLGPFISGKGRSYRPIIIVPVALSLLQLVLIISRQSESGLNNPDIRLWITLGCALLAATVFLYKYKHLVIDSPQTNVNET